MKKYFLISFILTLFIGVFFVAPVFAEDYGLNATAGAAGLSKYGSDLPNLIGKIVGSVLSLVGIIFFMLMLYGGLLWMTSRGNEEDSKKALNTIFAAIIGIIIILASYAITSFIFDSADLGSSTTETPGIETSATLCGASSGTKYTEATAPAGWTSYECRVPAEGETCLAYTEYVPDGSPSGKGCPDTPEKQLCCPSSIIAECFYDCNKITDSPFCVTLTGEGKTEEAMGLECQNSQIGACPEGCPLQSKGYGCLYNSECKEGLSCDGATKKCVASTGGGEKVCKTDCNYGGQNNGKTCLTVDSDDAEKDDKFMQAGCMNDETVPNACPDPCPVKCIPSDTIKNCGGNCVGRCAVGGGCKVKGDCTEGLTCDTTGKCVASTGGGSCKLMTGANIDSFCASKGNLIDCGKDELCMPELFKGDFKSCHKDPNFQSNKADVYCQGLTESACTEICEWK